MLTALIIILFTKYRRWQMKKQLEEQAKLSKSGIGFHTRLMEVIEERFSIKGYKKLCIRARVHINGKVVCKKMHTILKAEHELHSGDCLVIRYKPGKLQQVWVNNAA
jgi:hypothetical protein